MQQRHNCFPAASIANCLMTLHLLKVHLQKFLSTKTPQKCQILSCDTLIANERYVAPLILNLGPGWRRVATITPQPLYPRERTAATSEQEAGWALELLWAFLKTEKFRAAAGVQNQDRPASCLATKPTTYKTQHVVTNSNKYITTSTNITTVRHSFDW